MGRLTKEQIQFYKDNGYIQLKNVLSEEELSRVIEEYDALFKRKNLESMESSWVGKNENNRISDSPYTVKGVHNLQHHHAVFAKLLFNENLLNALEDVMGTPNIMLHHTKAHFKPPENGAAYPMHQDYPYFPHEKHSMVAAFLHLDPATPKNEGLMDYPYFPHEKHSMVAAFLHLDPATPKNGGLMVYPGSHKFGPLEDVGKLEGNFHYVDKKRFPLEEATPVIADRGDIVIFSYFLVHGSPLNTSDRPRRMFLAQFAAADDKPVGNRRPQPGYGLMVRGANLEKDAAISKQFE